MLKVGDKVIINENVHKWVEERNWDRKMLYYIGSEQIIESIGTSLPMFGKPYSSAQLHIINYHWPLDCLDSLEEKNQPYIKWYKKGKFYTD